MRPKHMRCVAGIFTLNQAKVVGDSVIVDILLIKLHHKVCIQRLRICSSSFQIKVCDDCNAC